MWVEGTRLVAVNVSRNRRCSQAEPFMISSRYSYGRKVRLKIGKSGEVDAEAQTVEEVNALIKIARENPKAPVKRVTK
jgi:hypothetical protein